MPITPSRQFSQIFKPSEYGANWAEVPHNEDFNKVVDEQNFSHKDMMDSLQKTGMQEPVSVYKGHVVDGHHRVAAAIDSGTPVRWQVAPSEMYEGQIRGRN